MTRSVSKPRKCLHVIEALHRGAVENWLVRMLRHARATNTPVDWTFYCTVDSEGSLEREVRDLGAGIVHSQASISRKPEFVRELRSELHRGRYEVLHGHHDLMNSIYLLAAIGSGVSTRIAHVHNADEALPTSSGLKQLMYREPMRQVCLILADRIVGISQHTLDTFLKHRPRRAGRDLVHYYGVDPAPFLKHVERARFRAQNRIPQEAPVMLFAGRLAPEKNPVFAVDVLAALLKLTPDVVGVFAGAGSEEGRIADRVEALGIGASVRMIGWRNDVPAVMGSADCFILPHPDLPVEGFGLAVVEAQLAGLRLLISEGVPDDPLLPAAVFSRLPISAGSARWGAAAAELLDKPRPTSQHAIAALRKSPMDMDHALAHLLSLHAA